MDAVKRRVLERWAGAVTARPWGTLGVALALGLASVVYALASLGFQPDRNDLVSRDLDWNARFIDWRSSFVGTRDLYVVIDSRGHPELAEPLTDWLGRALDGAKWIERAVWKVDSADASPSAIRLLPPEAFQAELERIAEAGPLLESPTLGAFVATIASQLQEQAAATGPGRGYQSAETIQSLNDLAATLDRFTRRIETPADEAAPLAPPEPTRTQYLRSPNGRLLLIRLTPRLATGHLEEVAPAIEEARGLIAGAREMFPEFNMGLTGLDVIDHDETTAATTDSAIASAAAAVLIAGVLIVAFRGWVVPVLLMAALGIGVAWSFGFATLAVGHLQVISVIFTAILLGLGVSFGIHLAARYELVRSRYPAGREGARAAVADAVSTMGPGLLTGAVTTSAAFSTTLFTDFNGVAEMGLIAGGGVLLCLGVMLTAFPAMLVLFREKAHTGRGADASSTARPFAPLRTGVASGITRRPGRTLVVAAVLTAMAGGVASRIGFSYDLLALLPTGMESIEWQKRLQIVGDRPIYTATSLTDSLEGAKQRAEAFRDLPRVAKVEGVGLLFTADETTKLQRMAEVRDLLFSPPHDSIETDQASSIDIITRLRGLRLLAGASRSRVPEAVTPAFDELIASIDRFLRTANALPPEVAPQRLAALNEAYIGWRRDIQQRVEAALDPRPLTPADLPGDLLRPFVSDDGRFALEVYPRVPDRIEHPIEQAFLTDFIEELRTVDPKVTGVIVQIYESATLIRVSYAWAGLYAMLAVTLLVAFDFRSARDALLCLLPVGLAFVFTFAVLVLSGSAINPANIVVLPLLFGIGVDSGVHVVHRFRAHPDESPPGLTAGTGMAITVTSLVTIIGFGSLALARHRGVASLGLTLAVGVAVTLLACWTVMPALLALRQPRKRPQTEDTAE